MTKTSLIELVWPEEYGDYKIVQVEFDSRSSILFGNPWSQNESLHGCILRNFLKSKGISFDTTFGESSGACIPKISGEAYRVLGMGQAGIRPEDKVAEFFGRSMDYGIGLDWHHLYRLEQEQKEWDFEFNGSFFDI